MEAHSQKALLECGKKKQVTPSIRTDVTPSRGLSISLPGSSAPPPATATWRRTQALTTNFNSVWKRFMDRVLKETRLTERFAERDIRAKVGSDAETVEKAAHILGNATTPNHPKTLPTEAGYHPMNTNRIAQHRIYSATMLGGAPKSLINGGADGTRIPPTPGGESVTC